MTRDNVTVIKTEMYTVTVAFFLMLSFVDVWECKYYIRSIKYRFKSTVSLQGLYYIKTQLLLNNNIKYNFGILFYTVCNIRM